MQNAKPPSKKSTTVKPTPVKVWENGLEGVNDAMQYMIDGKVSHTSILPIF